MPEKLVSVIIPTHNRGDLITETIESVLAQSYKNIEIIVVDNGSTDDTEEIIKKISAPALRYIKQENSGGPASPRNVGVGMARGEYIAFLDSDDIWLSDKIKRQVEIFEKMPEVGLVFCQCRFFGKEYHEKTIYPAKGYSGNVFDEIIKGNFVPTVSVVCRRATLAEIGIFDERSDLRAFEDYELWMRVARGYDFYFINEPLCLLRMHSQSMLGNDNLKSHLGAFRAL
ncbi:MAG TPA: glycosyltransferase, partial [Candidatus Wallbacteria bacterium]|nr:glycosyltransferase [Candidatus Wallbacteria bacterium]